MTSLESISEQLGLKEPWTQKGRAHWIVCGSKDTRALTEKMLASHARFITITAFELPDDEGIRMDYHWDLDGELLGFQFCTADRRIDSIYSLCEAANWIEREIHEYFKVEFSGREYEPLFLRNGQQPGVNLREEDE